MGSRGRPRSYLAAAAIAALPHAAFAQHAVEPRLTIGAGSATDALGVQSAAAVIAPGLTLRPSSSLTLGVGADVTRFSNDEWSAGGNGAVSLRLPLADFLALGVTGNAGLTQTSHQARYTSAEVIPALEATHGRVTLFAGGRGAWGAIHLEESNPTRPIPIGNRPLAIEPHRASLQSAVYGGVVRAASGPARGSISVREERGSVGDSALVDRSIGGTLDRGRISLSAALGTRKVVDVSEGYAQFAASVAARPGLALQLGAGRYAANPLTTALGGSYVSVGVTLSRAAGAAATLERPARVSLRGEAPPARGMTRMIIRAPDAREVELAGDWSSWKPVRARRARDGKHWYVDVALRPGRYRYAFRLDGEHWTVPDGTKAVDDGFGGKSAWVTIE